MGSGLLFPPSAGRGTAEKALRIDRQRSVRGTDAVKSEQPSWLSNKNTDRKRDAKAKEKSLL